MVRSINYSFFLIFILIISCSNSSHNQSETQGNVPFVKDGLWGLANWDGDVIFEPKWEKPIVHYNQNFFEYGLYSFINPEGIYVAHTESKKIHGPFDQVERQPSFGIVCRKGLNLGLINGEGELVLPFSYTNIFGNNRSEYLILTDKNYNVTLWKQGEDIPALFEYEDIKNIYFIDSVSTAFLAKRNGQFGVLNSARQVSIPFEYDRIMPLRAGGNQHNVIYLLAYQTDTSGKEITSIFDPQGKLILKGDFYDVKAYSSQLIGISERDKWCRFYGPLLQNVIADSLRFLSKPMQTRSGVQVINPSRLDGKPLYFDFNGKRISEEDYHKMKERPKKEKNPLGEIIEINKKRGFVGNNGDTLIPPVYYNVYLIGTNWIVTFDPDLPNDEKQVLYHSDGRPTGLSGNEILIWCASPDLEKYPYIRISRSDGMIYKTISGSNILDIDYEIAVPQLAKNSVNDEKQLVIKARINGKWGFWDSKGNILLAPEYDEVETFFMNNLYLVKKEGRQFVINSNGKVYV